MSDFNLAIPTVLRHEGGLVDNPNDPGGITNHGISLRWLKAQGLLGDVNHDGDVNQDDIKVMTVEDASAFYKKSWWDAYNYSAILAQAVATKVFDTAVNMGATRAHKFLQDAVDVTPDGVIGPATLARVNAANSVLLLQAYQKDQAAFYQHLTVVNPKLNVFLKGWMNRAYDRI